MVVVVVVVVVVALVIQTKHQSGLVRLRGMCCPLLTRLCLVCYRCLYVCCVCVRVLSYVSSAAVSVYGCGRAEVPVPNACRASTPRFIYPAETSLTCPAPHLRLPPRPSLTPATFRPPRCNITREQNPFYYDIYVKL